MSRLFWTAAGVVLFVVILVVILEPTLVPWNRQNPTGARWNDLRLIDAAAVFLIGAVVGAGELISRYKTDPRRAIESKPGVVYIAVNGSAAVLALSIVYAADIRFGLGPAPSPPPAEQEENAATSATSTFWDDDAKIRYLRILAAGFGAMALFRSSFFNVRVGDRDVPVGFSIALKAILDAVDRAVDRLEGLHRHEVVADRLLKYQLTFAAMKAVLPAYCFALLQNLTADEQAAVATQIQKIADAHATMTDLDQLRLLYLQLLTVVGEDVLAEAVEHFSNGVLRAAGS